MVNYKSQYMRYTLDNNEIKIIDEVWEFLHLFTKKFIFISDYRNYIIKKIRKKYTPEKFYKLESIANKLLWNMRWILYPFWKNQYISKEDYNLLIKNNFNNKKSIPNYLSLCSYTKFNDKVDFKNRIDSIKQNYA